MCLCGLVTHAHRYVFLAAPRARNKGAKTVTSPPTPSVTREASGTLDDGAHSASTGARVVVTLRSHAQGDWSDIGAEQQSAAAPMFSLYQEHHPGPAPAGAWRFLPLAPPACCLCASRGVDVRVWRAFRGVTSGRLERHGVATHPPTHPHP